MTLLEPAGCAVGRRCDDVQVGGHAGYAFVGDGACIRAVDTHPELSLSKTSVKRQIYFDNVSDLSPFLWCIISIYEYTSLTPAN